MEYPDPIAMAGAIAPLDVASLMLPVIASSMLAERAASINRHIDMIARAEASASSHRLRAGQELIEARKLVPTGEWLSWCAKNIKRGQRDIQRLIKIAGSADPDAALEQERATTRDASRRLNGRIPARRAAAC